MKSTSAFVALLLAGFTSALTIGAIPECATTGGLCASGDITLGDDTVLVFADLPNFLKCCGGYTCKSSVSNSLNLGVRYIINVLLLENNTDFPLLRPANKISSQGNPSSL